MSDRALSILVHGPSGAGKSTLGLTAPFPLLILDIERAARFLKGRKIKWNPLESAPPEADGTWDICVVHVDGYAPAQKAYEYLKSRKHPFRAVMVDSISELQVKAQEEISGRNQLKTQDWGKLLSTMGFFLRDLRDLAGDDDNTIEAVLMTSMSKTDNEGVTRPYLQGQIAAQVPYFTDITAYLYVVEQPDANGEIQEVRQLLIGNHPNYEAKSRVPGLPKVISNPNINEMLDFVFGEVD